RRERRHGRGLDRLVRVRRGGRGRPGRIGRGGARSAAGAGRTRKPRNTCAVRSLRGGGLLAAGAADRRRDGSLRGIDGPGGRAGRWRHRLSRLSGTSEKAWLDVVDPGGVPASAEHEKQQENLEEG